MTRHAVSFIERSLSTVDVVALYSSTREDQRHIVMLRRTRRPDTLRDTFAKLSATGNSGRLIDRVSLAGDLLFATPNCHPVDRID